jgi:hypothetical protein
MQCALWISIFSAEVDVPTRFADEGRDADVRDELPRLEGVDGPLVSSVDLTERPALTEVRGQQVLERFQEHEVVVYQQYLHCCHSSLVSVW